VVVRGGKDSLAGIRVPQIVEGQRCFRELTEGIRAYTDPPVNVCYSLTQRVSCEKSVAFWHVFC
jgi:hypothetical protein